MEEGSPRVEKSDFVVVGGGVYGAALAYELVVRGSSVTLLEADRLASRASGGPGKRGVRANGRNSLELSLAREALAMWPSLSEELGSETGFEQLGSLILVGATPDLGEIGRARAEAHQRIQLAHGIATELLDRTELETLEPGVGDSEICAQFCPDDGIADQGKTARAYAAAASQRGASVRESSPVQHIGASPQPFVHLRDGSRVEAGRAIVLTTNYGTNVLLERSQQPQLPLWTMAPQVLMFQAKNGYQPCHLVGHQQKTLAVKPLADGITMISGGMRGRWDADAAEGKPVEAMIQDSLDVAASVFPALSEGTLVAADASAPETFTPDGLPYVDFLDQEQRFFVAAGWHGHGFAIAPSLAKHAADWLTTGRKPELLAPFKIRRS
jgi:sarcosine oxidase subunit beta